MNTTEKKQTDKRKREGRSKTQDDLAYIQSNSGEIGKNSAVKKELQSSCHGFLRLKVNCIKLYLWQGDKKNKK